MQQIVQRQPLSANLLLNRSWCPDRVIIENIRLKPFRNPRKLPADTTEADNAHRLIAQLAHLERLSCPNPLSCVQSVVVERQFFEDRQNEENGVLGYGWRVGSAVIGNRHPELLEKLQVDPFIAGTQHLKQLEMFCRVQFVLGGIARIGQHEVRPRYFLQARVGWRALLQKIHTKARRQLLIDHVNHFGRD